MDPVSGREEQVSLYQMVQEHAHYNVCAQLIAAACCLSEVRIAGIILGNGTRFEARKLGLESRSNAHNRCTDGVVLT